MFSVRIDPKIGKEFTAAVKRMGLSTCSIVEAFMVGWIEGIKQVPAGKVDHGLTIKVNQNFQRVVKRERRSSGVTEFKPENNCYSKKGGGIWGFRRIDSPSDVNKFGHHINCECLDCSGRRANFL